MRFRLVAVLAVFVVGGAIFSASASAKGRDVFKVCKHGCKYSSVQKAVDKVKKGSKSMVKIKPGTYHEGVILSGHKYDKLIITGTTKPKKTILDGKNARIQGQPAQNGIDAVNVDGLKIKKLWARNYPTNGFFVHADPGDHCHGFAMDKDWASFNGSYGLFAKHCTGGKITNSKGWGQGDSAIYIGETPAAGQAEVDRHRQRQVVRERPGLLRDELEVRRHPRFDVLQQRGRRRSRTRSTPRSSSPTPTGRSANNDIFWNNFNYFLPKSPVQDRLRRARHDRRPDDQLPDRGRRGPVRLRRLAREEQQHLRQLHVGRCDLLGSVQHRGGRT